MSVEEHVDVAVSRIAAAIGEPARARMLYCLVDGHARTSTELAIVAEVSPSTASVHLNRLKTEHLVTVFIQGKHRYYSLEGPNVAGALEGLSVLAGVSRGQFVPNTPSRLRAARTCYDHMAGTLRSTIASRPLAGCQPVRRAAAMRSTSLSTEQRRLPRLALTLTQLGRCAGGSHTHASIGVSGGRMWAGRWGRLF